MGFRAAENCWLHGTPFEIQDPPSRSSHETALNRLRSDGKGSHMDDGKFQIECDAGRAGSLRAKTSSISVRIGQRVGNEAQAFWDSIIVLCEETADGTLSAKVIVCHPDWEQQLQVAHIQSRSINSDPKLPAFELDLKAVHV